MERMETTSNSWAIIGNFLPWGLLKGWQTIYDFGGFCMVNWNFMS